MNAGIYKLIFSKRLNALIVVGEICSSQGKVPGTTRSLRRSLKGAIQVIQILAMFSSGALLISSAWATPAVDALPTGGQVAQGSASISQSGSQMDINQASQRAIINWQSFDVGSNAKVHIIQPNETAALLNRVVTNKPSEIFGQIEANGQVVLVNPNGIVFGKDGSASASSFTASTLDINDDDFMAGNNRFNSNGSQGEVVNHGTIEAKNGGYVALLGAKVSNDGKIVTHNGTVALGAADSIAIPMTSSGKIKMELNAGSINAAVENTKNGVIVTEGGDVYLQAAAANNAMASIQHSGQIDASGEQAGNVTLLADNGEIKVDGSIVANSPTNQGGNIIIGRDTQTGVLASATDVTDAKLESQGGFVETSGHALQVDDAQVKAGNWLLDPDNIDITGDATAATAGFSKIKASDVQTALNNSTSVTIATTAANRVNQPTYVGSAVTGVGDILLNAAINKSLGTSATLTLTANNDITINAGITNTASNALTFNLNAGRHITTNADISTKGSIGFVAGVGGAGGNVVINNLLKTTVGLSVQSSYGAWWSGKGQIIFGANGKVSGLGSITLYSGLGYDSTTGVINNTRTSFDDSVNVDGSVFQSGSSGIFSVLGFDTIKISKPIAATNINIVAKNIELNNVALTSASWMQLYAAGFNNSDGVYNYNGWQNQSGQLLINGSTMLRYGAGSLIDLHSGIVDALTGRRATLDDTNVTWAGSGAGNVSVLGFDLIKTSKVLFGGDVWFEAKDINVGGNITSTGSVSLRAGDFDQVTTKGSYLSNTGWQNSLGQLVLNNSIINYTNNLDLRSGLAYDLSNVSTGLRSNLLSTNVTWKNNNPNYYVYLSGFDTATFDSAFNASNVNVYAKNINVNANIAANGGLVLNAASFDAAASIKGAYTNTGWKNLDGLVKVDAAKVTSLSATNFDFRSGVDPASRAGADIYSTGARIDLTGILNPYKASGAANPSAVTGVYLAGFQDVTLSSNVTEITGAGSYTVYARNINGASSLSGKTLNVYSLNLYAGSFTNIAGVFKYNLVTVGRNDLGMGGDTDNYGILTLPTDYNLQSSQASFMSGRSTVNGTSRADLSFATISPYVDPSNPTKYTGVYSTDGKSTGLRPGGARILNLHGFNNLTLPTNSALTGINNNALNYELVDITANNVAVNSDINAGQGGWWPSPFYLFIKAGSYNATTGINGGTNAGAMTFKPGIVLRDSALNLNGNYGWFSGNYGFDSGMTLINGSTPADFSGVKLGYTKYDYTAGATGAYLPGSPGLAAYTSLNISGFDNTDIQMEVPNDVLRIRTGSSGNSINITQRAASTGVISLHNDLDSQLSGSITLDAGNGSIRMGSHVAKTSSMTVNAGANSGVNIDADTLSMTSRIAGKTLVVNEANNLSVSSVGGAGNTEINARGEISLVNNVSLTGTAGLTLRADAQYGQTINDIDTSNSLIVEDLNAVFSTNQLTSADTTVGSVGGDGLGSIVVNTAQPTIVTPLFRQVVVADTANFTVNAANTYYKPDGTAYAVNDVITTGTIFMMGSGATVPTTLDTVVASGNPIRSTATVTQGGWTVSAANTYYDANGVALANGSVVAVGTTIYFKPSATKPTGNISLGGNVGGPQLYVVAGYTASNSTTSVANYTSLGFGTSASYPAVAGSTLAASATKLSTDTPVDATIATSYFGNPVSGTNNTLNLSGQFYTLSGTQAAPTSQNKLYVGKSVSGNGWDTGWGTATLTTAGGDLRLFSGPKHAIAGPGYAIGDAADLNIFSNPTTNDFTSSKSVMTGAIKLNSGTGNLVALGFRDVLVDASGVLTSSGNVTIGASRDLKFNADILLGGSGKLATLIAGGTITNKNSNGTYNTINNTSGQTRNLMLLAGGGVDLQTDVSAIAGSLQDNPLMTGALAGGITPTGIFSVKGKNGLVVGGDFSNAQVNNVTFDGTAGILYAATTPLTRGGIISTPIATGTGGVASNYGGVQLTAITDDLTVNKAIDTTATGGEINLKAAVNVNLATDIKTTQAAFIEASTGTILQTAGRIYAGDAVLTTPLALGSAANRIKTTVTQLGLNATGDIFIDEADSVTVSAKTTTGKVDILSDAGSITVGSLNLTPQVSTNAAGYNQVGITTPSSVLLTALNATSASDEAVKVNSSITAGGDVSLIGTSSGIGGVAVNSTITALGTISILGSASDGSAGVRLGSGAQINNNSISGKKTTIEAVNGNIVADSIGTVAAITQAATAGAVELTAGIGSAGKVGGINGTDLLITQNNNQGVLLITDGVGDVTAPKVINNGSGNVVIGAGNAFAANTGLDKASDNGGQVLTVVGNTITQNNTGNTRIYTGSSAASGLLSNLDNAFTNLYFSSTSNPLNTKLNTVYGTSLVGSNVNTVSQVMFRENITPTFVLTLPTVNITKLYGTDDPSIAALRLAAQTAYTNAGETVAPSILTSVYGVNSFSLAASEVLSSFTLVGRVAGENVIAGSSPYYDYTWAIPSSLNTSFAGATPTLQITPAPLTVTVNDASGFVTVDPNQYTAASDTFSYSGFLTGKTVNGVAINDSASSYFTNGALQFADRTYIGNTALPTVGTYSNVYDVNASALATTSSNYTLTVVKGAATVVAADSLLIKVADATKTYGDLLATNASKTAQTISAASYCLSGSQGCSGNNQSLLTVTDLGSGAWRVTDTTNTSYDFNITVDTTGAVNATGGYLNAGSYNFGTDLLATASSNFKGASVTGQLTVDKANLSLSGSRVYDATTTFAGQYLTATGVNGETFTVTGAGLAGNLTSKNVLDNPINTSLNSVAGVNLGNSNNGGIANNYNALSTANSSISVTKADLSLIGSRVYDGGTSFAGQYLLAQGVGGESFAITGAGDNSNLISKNVVDNQSVVLNSLAGLSLGTSSSGGDENNYNALSKLGSLVSVIKADATVTANSDLTKVYNGVSQSVTGFTATGLVNGETEAVLTNVTASGSGINAGTYSSVASGTDSNYNLSFVDGSLKISKANAIVTANSDLTKVYNGVSQSVTGFTATGLVNGETEAVLTNVTASGTGTNAGTYTSVASGADSNYNLSFIDGSLKINKANAIVTANSDLTKVYNGLDQSVTGFTATGLVNGETEAVLTNVTASGSGINAGTYSSVASGTDSNYNLRFVDGRLQIAKADATVTANSDLTKVYNGLDQSVTGFTATGLVNGETEAVLTNVTASGTGTNAGTYSSVASGTDSNYNLSFVDGSLQIDKAPLTLSASNLSKIYDGTALLSNINLITNGVFYSDQVNVIANGSFENNQSNVGTSLAYTLNNLLLSGSDANNYRIVNQVTGIGAIQPKPLIMIGSQAKDKVYDGNVVAQVTSGDLIGLVGNQTLGVNVLAEFKSADVANNIPVNAIYKFSDGQNGGLLSNYLLPDIQLLTACILPLPKKVNAVSEINPVPVNPKFEMVDSKPMIDEKVFGVQLNKDMQAQCSDEFSKECSNKRAGLRKGNKFETFY